MDSTRILARTSVVVLVLAATAPVLVSVVVLATFAGLAAPEDLPAPQPPGGQVSRVYDRNGREIAQFREFEQNLPVKRSDIPKHLKEAVIAAEDRGFYSHRGIEFRAILRALTVDLQSGEATQGGSTITQQYVRNVFPTVGKERTVGRKVREAILASQIDRTEDKEEILFNYLSSVYLGEGAYGVGSASETYFRKPVSKLTVSEAALLAGLIPAPSRYEPRGNPSNAEVKRRLVLDQMRAEGYLTERQHERALRERVWLAINGRPPREATVVYPPEQVVTRYPYFTDYVRRYLVAKYGPEAVFRGGLRVRTTLDPAMQAAAEQSVTSALVDTRPPLEMALVAVEPRTGYVRAMVGGRDFSAAGGQVNLALGKCHRAPEPIRAKVDVAASCWDDKGVAVEGGGTGRQSGSSWKPFVLAAALAKGIPDAKVYSAPSAYRIPGCRGERGCVIHNFEGTAGGRATLRRATHNSYNTVYAQVIREVGVAKVGEMAKKLGISSAWVATPEVHGPSYALGVQEVAPLDMASAYGVFANRGLRFEPTPAVWVKRPDGKLLEDNRRRKPKRVIDEYMAYNVTDILRGVITSGTARRADIGRPAAGKTGTSQEYRDAWFIGYTPTLSTAVWFGNKDRPTPLRDVKGLARVVGGSIPAETWRTFMAEALKDVAPSDFPPPPPPPPPPTSPTTGTTLPTFTVPDLSPTPTDDTFDTETSFYVDDSTTTTEETTTTTRRSGGLILPGTPPRREDAPTTTTTPSFAAPPADEPVPPGGPG